MIYDITILGGGIAGVFAAYKLSQNKNIKVCLIEFGRGALKRRKQLEAYLGCFPQSNTRLYTADSKKIKRLVKLSDVNKATKFVFELLASNGPTKKTMTQMPDCTILKKLDDLGYKIKTDNYVQWKPEYVHLLSRQTSSYIEDKNIVNCVFDTEIYKITKKNNVFHIFTENGEFESKSIILCLGRSGWRLTKDIFYSFDIVKNDNYSTFGFRGEISTAGLKNWNESHCTIRKDNLTIGPFNWYGTVIPEDHCDLVISSFRSNENRWKTEKVSFSVYMKIKNVGKGLDQLERLSKLAYILGDNRVCKGKVKDYLNGNFNIKYVPEYHWFEKQMREIDDILPNFTEKGIFYIPDIKISIPNIHIDNNLSTEIPGFFVAGESAGFYGILSAAISGTIASNSAYKYIKE